MLSAGVICIGLLTVDGGGFIADFPNLFRRLGCMTGDGVMLEAGAWL